MKNGSVLPGGPSVVFILEDKVIQSDIEACIHHIPVFPSVGGVKHLALAPCNPAQVVANETELLPHCPQRQTSIADGFIDKSKAKPLPVKAGGAVLFHPMTPHASLPNISDGIRWSFDLRFNKTGQPTGRSHFPDFVARSRKAPDTELRDWKKWKAMWEDARAELARAPHIDIHRWSSDAPVCA